MLNTEKALLLVVDIQDAFVPHIFEMERVVKRAGLLVQGAQLLGLPVLATEQYPKGLGHTVPAVKEVLSSSVPIYEKIHFSCYLDPAINAALQASGRRQILIAGIESHICVAQTALSLRAADYDVFLAADAVSSRQPGDMEIALKRLRHAGVIVTTAEAALMEMTVSSKHPQFKEISKLSK
jgi:nicotinamidase-related amidase